MPRSLHLLAALLFTATLQAQEPTLHVKAAPADKPADSATLSLSAKLVNLPVVVYDKKGALIQTLTRSDFALTVDGHAQTIKYFDRDQDLPLTFGLLVDVSRSQSTVLPEERTASSGFIDGMLAPAAHPAKPDQAFVIQFGHTAELLGDMTESKPKLQANIQQIDIDSGGQPQQQTTSSNDPNDPNSPANTGGRGGGRGGYGGHGSGGGTVLYDAVYLSSNDLLKPLAGRKALVLLTDGVDIGSKKTIGEAIEAAQRADVMIFSIYFRGEEHQDYGQNRGNQGGGRRGGGGGYPGGGGGYPGGGGGYPGGGGNGGGGGNNGGNGGGNNGGNQPQHRPYVDGKKVLERMSEETGGRLFEVSRKQKVADIYKMIADELRGEYRLGYVPDTATAAEGYHKVELTIPAHKEDYIQTREGYYTGK